MSHRLEATVSNWADRLLAPVVKAREHGGVVVLILHSIRERPRFKIDVPSCQLRLLIDSVRDTGAEIVHLQEAVDCLRSNDLSKRRVVLTFDDGYKDFLDAATPVLREKAAPATVSIVPHYVDTQEPFEFDSGRGRYSMSWPELRELQASYGDLVTIANHSHRHRDFSKLTQSEIVEDVEISQDRIATELGLETRFFTYPYGTANARAGAVLLETFEAVLGASWGLNIGPESTDCLSRIPIFFFDRPHTLALKARGLKTSYYLGAALVKAFGRSSA